MTKQVMIIQPREAGLVAQLREVWRNRALTRFFASKYLDKMTVRTVLGKPWLIVRPAMDTLAMTLVFGGILAVPSNSLPYPLFFISGRVCWALFEKTLTWSTRSIEINRRLLSKVYFPRLILPLSSIAPAIIEVLFYLVILVAIVLFYAVQEGDPHLVASYRLVFVVPAMFMALALAMSIGLWTAVLGANVRDIRFSLGFVLGFWLYLTPVVYPLSAVPEKFHLLASLNPMTPAVELFRYALFGSGIITSAGIIGVVVTTLVVGVGGIHFFIKNETKAVDKL